MRRTAALAAFALLLSPLAVVAEDPPDVGKTYQKKIDKAWKQAAGGKSPADACSAIKGKVQGLLGRSHDDEVMADARPALNVCDVTLPAHYLDNYLTDIEGGDKTCVNFMVEVKTQLTAMTIDLGLRDPEFEMAPKRAIKELLRERVEAVCPEVAVVVLR